jgi:hypothetical protein
MFASLHRLFHDVRTVCSAAGPTAHNNPEIMRLVSIPRGESGECHLIGAFIH